MERCFSLNWSNQFAAAENWNGTFAPITRKKEQEKHQPKWRYFLSLGLRIREFSQLTLSGRSNSKWKCWVQNGSANTIRDKSVETFRENYHFIAHKSHSITAKNIFTSTTNPPMPCYVETRFVVTILIREKMGEWHITRGDRRIHLERERLFWESVSTSFVLDFSLEEKTVQTLHFDNG